MATQDAASPWVFDTRELVRRAGAMKETSRVVTAPDQIGTDVIAIKAGDPVELELRMESVMEGVLATGSVGATATGVCVRCLDDLEIPVEVTFQELFAYPDRAAHHQQVAAGEDEQDDVHELEDDQMDLEELVRDAVVTALPFQPVCRDDCPGLCSECGARLADDPEHHHDVIDPRWSALADLAHPGTDDEKKRN
ncbi:YceD family protein [Ornithinimicrobium murale]|uniref:YceD family protein n=1 Tax=Ornithinimicrobium murale TaxID=1050153 RepID=UPI000E0D0A20|nr:YceD family protein [Ornithinimicrobium murale]